jgi:prephenate dehydrogenase
VALAVQRSMPSASVRLWARRAAAVDELRAMGIADLVSDDPALVAQDADLMILAVPVPVMAVTLAPALEALAPNALITDVGSVKQSVVAALEPMCLAAQRRFVGSHPMAGSHRLGISEARADLFEGAACILTPTAHTDNAALATVAAFWQTLGARTLELDPATHDQQVARVSHLPHATAFALALAALQSMPDAVSCAGKGFRDTTRIAGSDPDLWTGIFLENREQLIAALCDQLTHTKELLDLIESNDKEALRAKLAEAQALRQLLPDSPAAPDHGTD